MADDEVRAEVRAEMEAAIHAQETDSRDEIRIFDSALTALEDLFTDY